MTGTRKRELLPRPVDSSSSGECGPNTNHEGKSAKEGSGLGSSCRTGYDTGGIRGYRECSSSKGTKAKGKEDSSLTAVVGAKRSTRD